MASEVAQAPAAPTHQRDGATDALPESTSHAEPQVNGVGASEEAAANASGFNGNASLPATDLDLGAKAPPLSSTSDANAAGSAPASEVAPGIQPIADFVPKDASTHSHPTPPPDDAVNAEIADVDTEMGNVESDASPALVSQSAIPVQPEQSLVRPREDDGEDEPAAKRTRVDGGDASQAEASLVEARAVSAPAAETDATALPINGDAHVDVVAGQDAPKPVESLEQEAAAQPMEDVVPGASSVPVEPLAAAAADVKTEAAQPEAILPDATAPPIEPTTPAPAVAESQGDAKPAEIAADSSAPSQAAPAPAPDAAVASATATKPETKPDAFDEKGFSAPMTSYQKAALSERVKNLKKTKHSFNFLRPVDPVALNIPSYPDIVKQPMDLGTIEKKLRNDEYGSVRDLIEDFELVVNNCRRFNGDQHPVTQAAFNMKAYFDRVVASVPSADEQQPAKIQKRGSPAIAHDTKRREARAPPPAAAPAVQAPSLSQQPSFALQSDGTPQIRRASSNARPARAIKPPQNREIPYAKPKRKEHLLELKFSEYVLNQIRSAKYASHNNVFQNPVDPVALNIPNYHQVIKQPMDLSTMAQKMNSGQYGTAAEFKKDFELMIRNCLTFNPVGNPVRDMAVALERDFSSLWGEKNRWEKKNAPASARASSASADGDSDEEEEEDDGGDNPNDSTVAALKKQIAAMQSTLESLSGAGGAPKGAAKPARSHKKAKKAGGPPAPVAPKPAAKVSKPKKERMITYEEKDEISKAVERMDEKQIGKLTEIITRECPKYRDMEEMELEIDDLPNNVQLMLLHYVRGIFGNPTRKKNVAARSYSPDDVAAQDDDDFEPRSRGAGAGGRAGGKRKKHAPMTKAQQEEQLRALQGKLAEFSNAATSGSESPSGQAVTQPESSGDEEEEESEEE